MFAKLLAEPRFAGRNKENGWDRPDKVFHGQPCMKQMFLRSLYPYSHGCFPRTTHIWGASLSHRNSFLSAFSVGALGKSHFKPLASQCIFSTWPCRSHSRFTAHAVCIHAAILVSAQLPEAFDLARQISVAAVLQQSAAPQDFLGEIDSWSWNIEAREANPSKFSGFWLIC